MRQIYQTMILFPYTTLFRSQQENPMRGAKLLKDYMSNSSRQPDEEVQNDFGAILNRAAMDPKVNKVAFFEEDRKSTRLNSSHEWISYAVVCLKKKNINRQN